MDVLEAILTRRSIRKYTDKPISDEDLHKILAAGMAAPTAADARDWSFIVVRDKETLNKMADGNGRAATPLRNAAVGILVCGDLDRAIPQAPDYWKISASSAAENMLLAAHGLGIGGLWIGTWPQEEKVNAQRAVFDLPETVVPHSILAFGYLDGDYPAKRQDYEEDRVHFEKW